MSSPLVYAGCPQDLGQLRLAALVGVPGVSRSCRSFAASRSGIAPSLSELSVL